MRLFNLFGTKPAVAEAAPKEEKNLMVVEGNSTSEENKQVDEPKGNVITITWGTGMPIDVIFGFIHRDFEKQGYEDALVNSDVKYRETKEGIIRNDLKMLFRRISLRYQNDIRTIEVQIENARASFAFNSASLMEVRKMTYEEHLAEIEEMEHLLDENDPKMMTMIESYRRGFLKGITAQSVKFVGSIGLGVC